MGKFEFIQTLQTTISNFSKTGQPLTISVGMFHISTSWFDDYRLTFRGYMRGFMWICTIYALLRRLSPRISISNG